MILDSKDVINVFKTLDKSPHVIPTTGTLDVCLSYIALAITLILFSGPTINYGS